MSKQLPYFRYHPNPIKTGSIIKKKIICEECGKVQEYSYKDKICPWCLSKRTEKKVQAFKTFIEEIGYFEYYPERKLITDLNLHIELEYQTPKYISWQENEWLIHCNDFCAFIDYVGWEDIKDTNDPLLLEDIKQFIEEGLPLERLTRDGSMVGYLFQCLHCQGYRLHIDFD